MELREGGLDRSEVVELLRLHLGSMAQLSPPESVHALDLDGLAAPEVSFWAAWEGDELLGCGALKALGAGEGEIKSMRTATAHLRKGVGSALLAHIVAAARARGWRKLWLETGSGPAFETAHAFYRGFGFRDCPAFADYPPDDPFSRFMSLEL
jgi:putative acetyltransferase